MLADWNGLMIAALTHAARMFDRPEWLSAAATAFGFIVQHMEKDGRLVHSWRAGQAKVPGTASDYANMIWGALRLLQATNERGFLTAAERWCATLDTHFWVADGGGYAFTADDTPDVIVRMRGAHDDATPNANADHDLQPGGARLADRQAGLPRPRTTPFRRPSPPTSAKQHARSLRSAGRLLRPDRAQQIVVIVPGAARPAARSSDAMFKLSLPGAVQQVVGVSRLPADPALAGETPVNDEPTAYACIGPLCSLPVADPDALVGLLVSREHRVNSKPAAAPKLRKTSAGVFRL